MVHGINSWYLYLKLRLATQMPQHSEVLISINIDRITVCLIGFFQAEHGGYGVL
jgi:hypothetical protein